jgi:hypothetical protein
MLLQNRRKRPGLYSNPMEWIIWILVSEKFDITLHMFEDQVVSRLNAPQRKLLNIIIVLKYFAVLRNLTFKCVYC